MREIIFQKKHDDITCVSYRNCTKSFPLHTHTAHLIFGMVEKGEVCVIINTKKKVYHEGEQFQIFPNTPHQIEPVNNKPYSMKVSCIREEISVNENHLKILRDNIVDNPGNKLLIEDMAEMINVSKYHLIRQFKKAFGLTPHQFQLQCRVRKAQMLLEKEGITEASYDSGFCDESHLDRCFRKIVQLTPTEYRDSIEYDSQNTI